MKAQLLPLYIFTAFSIQSHKYFAKTDFVFCIILIEVLFGKHEGGHEKFTRGSFDEDQWKLLGDDLKGSPGGFRFSGQCLTRILF